MNIVWLVGGGSDSNELSRWRVAKPKKVKNHYFKRQNVFCLEIIILDAEQYSILLPNKIKSQESINNLSIDT